MPPEPTRAATFQAGPNIALVKYWGVRDERLALPYNSSVSMTLGEFRTRTTVRFDSRLLADRFELDGVVTLGAPLAAVSSFLDLVRSQSGVGTRAEVRSSNNFQTASGLASSASGFAALAGAATSAAGLRLSTQRLSQLARFGSGSACRSIFGGFVEWQAGVRRDGRDCLAHPLFGPTHWPSLVDLVVLVRDAPSKSVRSAEAMQSTVRTSPEYAERQRLLPARIAKIRTGIRQRDPDTLFPLIIEECDNFRLVCETTDPPLNYLTSASRAILTEVLGLNDREGRPVAAYTHDAGAHIHVFTLRKFLSRVQHRLTRVVGVERTKVLHPGPGARRVAQRAAR